MKEENMRFGSFIRSRRLQDPRGLTLKDVSAKLGISLSFLSDIEQGRRKPLDKDKIECLCRYLGLPDSDKAMMYDLAAREDLSCPSDLDDIFLFSEVGSMSRLALRMTNEGLADEEDWKAFIRQLERKKGREL